MGETTAAESAGAEPTTDVRCPLCGKEFNESEGTACVFCRRRAGCGMVACPRCGHEFPRIVQGTRGRR